MCSGPRRIWVLRWIGSRSDQSRGHSYTVWVRRLDPGSSATSLGALQLNDNLEGEVDAVTPLRAFDIIVAPEPAQTATDGTGSDAEWWTEAGS